MMTTTRRSRGTAIKLRRPVADAKIKPAESVTCGNGHEFGLDRQRFYATMPNARKVTCPFCGDKTPLPAASAR